MSGGWREDPELAKLRNIAADDARRVQQQVETSKREMDAFAVRYGAMISGGFAQAADVLRASGRYGNLVLKGPESWRPNSWEIRGERWGEPTSLLSLDFQARILEANTVRFNDEYLSLEKFSEEWFREVLRAKVRELVS